MDPKTAKGLAILPTRGRVTTRLPEFFAAAKATGMTIPGAVIIEEDEYAKFNEEYDNLALPDNWTVHVVRGGSCAAATQEAFQELFTDDMDYLFWIADDLIPETQAWDTKVIETLSGYNCISTNDGMYGTQKFNGATAWSGDLLRAVGYIYPPNLRHFFFDTCWEILGKLMNVWNTRADVLVRHSHESVTGRGDATTARTHKAWDNDERVFGVWKNGERLEAANRIGKLLIEYGVAASLPDLSTVRVMIATPSGDGKYDGLYTTALFGTIALLRQCGAQVNFSEMKFCSDIALARARIFGAFLRSDATHLLSIDSDMGWQPNDVVRLFSHKRDFVAVAGPRKVSPPSFAVQNTDNKGRAVPLLQEATGLIQVSDIGMAFALVTRSVCERVAAAYPELEFSSNDGRTEYAVFNPIVVNRRYKSEDFAFCHRWRALGGKIYIDPAIALQHVGTHVWEGDWLSHLVATAPEQRVAA